MRRLFAALIVLAMSTGYAAADFKSPCKRTERTQDAFNCLEQIAMTLTAMQNTAT